jgi:D-3-phosphoglycerate dehydrogenase
VNLISKKEFDMMKPNAIIVNCARGGIIDEEALYDALKNKRIFGAGIDVFEKEPTPDNYPLLKLDNILTSPHNAGTSVEGKNAVVRMAIQNVIDIAEGKKPAGVKNPEVFK